MRYQANKRVFSNIVRSLSEKRRIKTTLAKARVVQSMVEKQMSKTKKDRNGGYTRIIKIGKRLGDAAEMVFLEFVDAEPVKPEIVKTKKIRETPKIEEAKVVTSKKRKSSKVS